jgi:histidinol phosphatase-like enzyme (inositol monophosphatase family)
MNLHSDDALLTFMHALADAADRAILPYFRKGTDVSNKLDGGFDPVTQADKDAEQAMRALIDTKYPSHGIFGEEFGVKPQASPDQPVWILDPLDGTRSFITGMLNWMTLIGLTNDEGAFACMASQGFTAERFFASKGKDGAWYRAPNGALSRLETSSVTALSEAKFCTTVPELFEGDLVEPYEKLKAQVKLTRYSGDGYFYCMLAAGQIDLIVEPGLQAYDIAGLIPLVENAGGVVTTLTGEPAHHGGKIIAAATPSLHAAALNHFAQQ